MNTPVETNTPKTASATALQMRVPHPIFFSVGTVHLGSTPHVRGKAIPQNQKGMAWGLNPTCVGKDFLTSNDTGWLPEIHSLSLMGRVGGARLR